MKNCLMILALCFSLAGSVCAQSGTSVLSRITPSLRQLLQQVSSSDSIDIVIVLEDTNAVSLKKLHILSAYPAAGAYVIRTTKKDFEHLITGRAIQFSDRSKKPKEELTSGFLDLAVNKINLAHHRFPDVNGSGLFASVKEQSPDTADLDFKGRFRNTGLAAPTTTSHANIMATTLAGGGNTSPFALGVAPSAIITSTSFSNLLPEPDAWYRQNNISIQNHSYGTVSENYYGAEALAYDQSILNNPTLVSVFSSGNAGSTVGKGPYANLQGYANITGNFKLAKNVITVGAIDSFYQVPAASSKGPAFDGRIKPELVAFGEDGSSGAAAMVSGTAALLQHAYRNLKGRLPSAALVKAVLLNAADEAGTTGLDYASGFGSVNAHDAIAIIQAGTFYEDSVGRNNEKKYTIHIPAGAASFKATLAWTDPPATVNATKALVHDLDLVLQHVTTGALWQPWILNAAPHLDSITKAAVRGRDTVNNVEQISVSQPAAGDYILTVKANSGVNGLQPFAVALQQDSLNQFLWSFPTGSDKLQAGKRSLLRWQTTVTGTGTLWGSYNGKDWNIIHDKIDLATPYYRWDAPDTIAQVQLRMQANNLVFYSDSFVVSRELHLQTGFSCNDSFLLYWNRLPVAKYQLYVIGEYYMEPLLQTTDTAVVLHATNYPQLHYSVAPVLAAKEGLRSATINYKVQGANCYIRSFYLQEQDSVHASFFALLGSSYAVDSVGLQKWTGLSYRSIRTIGVHAATAFVFNDSTLQQGTNLYRLRVKLQNGKELFGDPVSMMHFPITDVIIFPNPVQQNATVQIAVAIPGKYTMQLFDAAGRKLTEMKLGNLLHPLQQRLMQGIYFLTFISEEGARSTQRLVVY